MSLTISALYYLKVIAYDNHNAYLTPKFRENIWTVEVPVFGSDQGKFVLVFRALYGLKLSGESLRDLCVEQLHDLGYRL